MVKKNDETKLELLKALAQACRDEGVRRGRIGDIEVELHFVKNPLERPAATAPASGGMGQGDKPKPTKPGTTDWADASGGALAVLHKNTPKGG